MYLGGDPGWDREVEAAMPRIVKALKEKRYKFIHIPSIVRSIPQSAMDYYLPASGGVKPALDELWAKVKGPLGLGMRDCGMLVMTGEDASLHSLPDTGTVGTPEPEGLEEWLIAMSAALPAPESKVPRARKLEVSPEFLIDCASITSSPEAEIRFSMARMRSDEVTENERECAEYVSVNKGVLMALGLDPETLARLFGTDEKLSHVHITCSGRIILEDYNKEILLDDLSKALYFLYLRHPEGIRIKELYDYYPELLDLYQSVSGREDKEGMRQSIFRLVEPGNDVNVLISRIKKAFSKEFSPNIAKNYCIVGSRGEPRTIALDRALVTWDTLRRGA